MRALDVIDARPDDAEAIVGVIHRSFGARKVLDPPSTALDETTQSVRKVIESTGGLLVERRERPMGAMLFDESRTDLLGLRRVAVDPEIQSRGIASAMVGVAEDVAEERGKDGLWLHVREELPDTIEFWRRRRYVQVRSEGPLLLMGKTLWLAREVRTVDETQAFAARLAGLLRAGDVIVMNGGLGAGKTTFTQGLGAALKVRGRVTSPTFVIARTHPPLADGPSLVHVDAYRLGDSSEIDDIDLDATTDDAVTVVEWGEDMAEQLSDSWLEINIENRRARVTDPLETAVSGGSDETRVITVKPHGPRWIGEPLRSTLLV